MRCGHDWDKGTEETRYFGGESCRNCQPVKLLPSLVLRVTEKTVPQEEDGSGQKLALNSGVMGEEE